ncbi:MAG: hypothetical protein U9Q61_05750 [Thermodesulfobacteriota bacterium]|nr:hypothetical protein [Thermodesulfobacteriota bacterium]
MFWFIVLLLFVGAGFYFYQKIISIEREIQAEQEMTLAQNNATQKSEKPPEEAPQATVFDSKESSPPAAESSTLEDSILAEVTRNPGLKQTDLYPLFSDTNKKQLQRLIKEMADNGRLKREKKSSSYLLYPV